MNGFYFLRFFLEYNIIEIFGLVGVLILDFCLYLVIFIFFFLEENKVLKKENSRF